MIIRASEPLGVSLGKFMEILKQIDNHLFQIDGMIMHYTYTRGDIIGELEHVNMLIQKLENIFTLIIKKAQGYEPNNTILYNHLRTIEVYLKKLKQTLQIAEVAYERDRTYGIKGVDKDIINSMRYIKLIKNELNIAIQQGLIV